MPTLDIGLVRNMLRSQKQRAGFTEERLAGIFKKSDPQHENLRELCEQDFIVFVSEHLEIEPWKALLLYMRAVAARLPDNERTIVEVIFNLHSTKREVPAKLGDRQDLICKMMMDRKVTGIFGKPVPLEVWKPARFREAVEPLTIDAYAKELSNPKAEDFDALSLPRSQFAVTSEPVTTKLPGQGRVVVFGAAVMDVNFHVENMPPPKGSVQARDFSMHPGGKGLTQAVACARLGLKTQLVSVIGDDDNGKKILSYLASEGVDTTLVHVEKDQTTAVTGVFFVDSDSSSAIGWKNEEHLRYTVQDLKSRGVKEAIASADAFLATFELPAAAVGAALEIAENARVCSILTPAPPYVTRILNKHIGIDFLVSNSWEMGHFAGPHDTGDGEDLSVVAARLRVRGIRNVVVTTNQSAYAYFEPADGETTEASHVSNTGKLRTHERPGERDAFCAMLALQLIRGAKGHAGLISAIDWATAAMCSLIHNPDVPNTMPAETTVEKAYHHLQSQIRTKGA